MEGPLQGIIISPTQITEREPIKRRTDRSCHQADSPLCLPAMSTPLLAATADGEQGKKYIYSLACNVNALVAATANCELENKIYWLACDVYALVAATADHGELENKHYFLAGNVYALVGCNR